MQDDRSSQHVVQRLAVGSAQHKDQRYQCDEVHGSLNDETEDLTQRHPPKVRNAIIGRPIAAHAEHLKGRGLAISPDNQRPDNVSDAQCNDALPMGLMAALRECKSALLAQLAKEQWTQPGYSTRYSILADLIEQEIADGKWGSGERMPSHDHLAEMYGEKPSTAARALHVLTVRGQLALEYHLYYVLPRDLA